MELIGREKQVEQLLATLAHDRPEMVAVVGRRRVGKTFLIRQTYGERIVFDLTGLQTGAQATQLQAFYLAYLDAFPEGSLERVPESWLLAFHALSTALGKLALKQKPVIFLDELPWLATPRSGFIEALGWFWNSWAVKQNVVVVICGSAAAWMINKVINDRGGLHNRVTKLMHLEPFTLRETALFCKARGLRLPRYHLLQLYMVMGGIPMYLDQLKAGLTAAENIQAVCFSRDGYLRREFSRLFASLFANYENHVAVVRALANRRIGLTRKVLQEELGTKGGGSLSRTLNELIESGFITAYQGYKKKRRDELYRLTDHYSMFYLTYLEPRGKDITTEFTQLSSLPSWRAWSGYAFETVCLTHVSQLKQALGISGVSTQVSSFYDRGTTDRPGAQIDLLLERADAAIHVCEVKFSQSPLRLSKALAHQLEQKVFVFAEHTGTKAQLLRTLLCVFPPVGDPVRYGIDRVVTAEALFA